MCQSIFLLSKKELPLVQWRAEAPSFHVMPAEAEALPEGVLERVSANYFYQVGAFTGCTCGLATGEEFLDDEPERRVNDVKLYCEYLATHAEENTLYTFSTWFDKFPRHYDVLDFRPQEVEVESYDPLTDVIQRIVDFAEKG